MPAYFIGLDIGTTSSKAIAFDQAGQILAIGSESYPTLYPADNQAIQNPVAIWEAVQQSVKMVLENTPSTYQLAGVGISAAMHSLMAIDENNMPIADLMIWSDNRATDTVAKILSQNGDTFYDYVGVPLHSMTPFAKLLWAAENQVDWFRQAYKFVGIKEWIWYKLTGKYEIDFSMAGAMGLFDIHQLKWYQPCLTLLNITADKLPLPFDTLTVRFCKDDLLFPANTKLIIGATDGCLANLGANAIDNQAIAITIGTSAAARAIVSEPLLNQAKNTFCYYLSPNYYVVGGGANSGGIVLEWFVKNFAQNNYDTFYQWVQEVAVCAEGLLCLPYLQGERAPVWNASAVGVFHGLTMRHTPAHLARAIVEGILLNIKQIVGSMKTLQGHDYQVVKVGGGSSVSPIILQLLADVLGIEVQVIHTTEHSAWGAALLAMEALGFIEDYHHLPATDATAIYQPNLANTKLYNAHLERFVRLYQVILK